MEVVMEVALSPQTPSSVNPSSSLTSKGRKTYASLKAIENFMKLVLGYAPYGSEAGKPKACLWKLDASNGHPLFNHKSLHNKCDQLIAKVLRWSSSEVCGDSKIFSSPELVVIHSCVSMVALCSPHHYPTCAQTLSQTLRQYKKKLSEIDNMDHKIKKFNFKQTQRRLSRALNLGGAAGAGRDDEVEDDDEDRDVIHYYQFLMVLNSIKNYAAILIRHGKSGVRMLRLTSVQERERYFQHTLCIFS
jgi:hypothetical protein